jgi:hypothetical protein
MTDGSISDRAAVSPSVASLLPSGQRQPRERRVANAIAGSMLAGR